MGGSSVPSSTTQTTMLDPTRQAALKKSMGYFDKWANSYNGPTYKGPLTAGRTSDWYAAQNMAHKMANRFSEGGLADLRGYAKMYLEPVSDSSGSSPTTDNTTAAPVTVDTSSAGYTPYNSDTSGGGITLGSVVGPPSATSDQSYGPVPYAGANDQMPTGYNNTYAFDNPNLTYATVDGPISAYSDQTVTDKPQVTADTPSQQPAVTYTDAPSSQQQLEDKAVNVGYQGDYTDTAAMNSFINANNQSVAPAVTQQPLGIANEVSEAGLDALKDKENVANTGAANTGAANTGLDALKDKVNVADIGAGKTDAELAAEKAATEQAAKDAALQKAITDANLTPANVTPTITSTNMGSPYLLGQALTLGGAGSAFRLGSDVTPKQIYNSYNTPDKFTPDTWNKAAMDTYMSPYTQGVVDIALREAARQRGIERLKENTAATQSGAFGGYRQGVVEAEGERNYNQLLNDIETKGYQNAYTDAVSQFAADRAAKQAAYTANQQALQAAATGDISAGQYNQANKFQAFTNQLNALNQGVNNVQNLGALETAYQNAMGNAGAALTSTDASARASDQATIDALKQLGIDITNVDWTKAQNLSTLAGLSQNNSNVQIKQTP